MNTTTATATPATLKLVVGPTVEQYRGLQHPVLPTREQLFDYMVEVLVDKGLATYCQADPFRKNLPTRLFLLVPPQPKDMDLSNAVLLIEVDGKDGHNYLDPQHLKDEIEVPSCPYLMVDIEDGRARLNTEPSVSRRKILAKNRSPYTTWRGIVHAIVFPEVFQSHNMDLVGSRCKSEIMPGLYLCDGRPELSAHWDDVASPEWGAPSCGRVIVP